MPTEKDVLAALSTVMDPELNVSLVQAGMVKSVRVDGGRVAATIELTTPACPLKGKIQADAEAALKSVPGVTGLDITWGAQVRGQPQGTGMLPGVKNIILDGDFYGPWVPMMTGLSDQRPVSPDGKHLEPLEAMGMKVMSLGFLVEPDQALIWRGPMLHGALQQLIRDVNWGALDYLVMDLPPGTGDVALTVSQSIRASCAVLVTTPQDVALADVVRAKQMFDKTHIPVLGIVENMSQFICPHCHTATPIFHHGGGRRAAELFGVPFLGEIPLEIRIRVGGDEGRPIVTAYPDSAEAEAFMAVARAVAGRVSVANGARAPAAAVP